MKIALTGKMRSGKDTLADYLINQHDFTRFAFGDGIKNTCRELFPNQMSNGKKPRRLLQGIGQDMRKYDENIWVNLCFNNINTEIEERELFNLSKLKPIITDLRQPNEFKKCKEEGFYIIKVHTDDEIRLKRMNENGDNFTLKDLNHETESHVDTYDCDFTIYNNGSLKKMLKQIEEFLLSKEEI